MGWFFTNATTTFFYFMLANLFWQTVYSCLIVIFTPVALPDVYNLTFKRHIYVFGLTVLKILQKWLSNRKKFRK